MIELYSGLVEHVSAPPLAPVERPIDLEHLFRMTLGDHSLEREVLALFDRQAGMLMERIAQAEPGIVAAAAHTLKGSARGIGAWQVARAADTVEAAAMSSFSRTAMNDRPSPVRRMRATMAATKARHTSTR
jgi:HPt (histidine-containing phosphotransfer) domain-containing protein